MPNAWMTFAGVVVCVLLGVTYRLGLEHGAQEAWDHEMAVHDAERGDALLEAEVELVRVAAFARAAQAVTLWPHRIDKRADLARHLESLATAPELGAVAPNPEPVAEVEASSASPVSSAAPVFPVSVGADEVLGAESGAEGRLDPMEGFL